MPHRAIALDDSRSKAWPGARVGVLVLAAVIGVPAFAANPANLKAIAPEAKAVQVGKPVLVTFHVDRVARPSSDTVVVRSPGSPSRLSTSVPVGAPKAIRFIETPQSTREFQQVVLSSDFGALRVASIELTPVR